MEHNIQLFLKLANRLGIVIRSHEDADGNTVIEAEDKIKVFGAYKEIIERQLKVKTDLVTYLDMEKDSKSGIEKLRLLDEINGIKRECIDLEVELIAKDDYIRNYQGHISLGMQLLATQFAQSQKEMPDLLRMAKEYVEKADSVFSKLTVQIAGVCSRFVNNEIRSQVEYIQSWKQLRNLMATAAMEVVDEENEKEKDIDLSK